MTGIKLALTGSETKAIDYEYKCREEQLVNADTAEAVVPQIDTKVILSAEGRDKTGYFREGYAFSPMFTLGYTGKLSDKEVFTSWLKLEKAN